MHYCGNNNYLIRLLFFSFAFYVNSHFSVAGMIIWFWFHNNDINKIFFNKKNVAFFLKKTPLILGYAKELTAYWWRLYLHVTHLYLLLIRTEKGKIQFNDRHKCFLFPFKICSWFLQKQCFDPPMFHNDRRFLSQSVSLWP